MTHRESSRSVSLSLSLFAAACNQVIHFGPNEMVFEHKIRVNLKIGTKNTRIGVPPELEGIKTTLYRDNTTLRWILFEDRVAPRHQRQLPVEPNAFSNIMNVLDIDFPSKPSSNFL